MNDKITSQRLQNVGFKLEGSMTSATVLGKDHDILTVFSKGEMVIYLRGDSSTAYKAGHELGPVTTMEQVQMLDSVINPTPQDTITVDALFDLGWVNDGFRRFFKLNFGIDMQDESATSFPLYSTAGLTRIHLGWVATMSEVKSLTEIATRVI